ncbi:S-adenosyl methyltransferase [Herbihabitans rhizosphaerae]|uniref:S-adenosyl methyltransferase n=1 Tax=Herbihabitans rhizosphaerae TaxID=1872711 RepID=A0A4Q7KEZ0_9PSEU|nr:SAM-dependent methyltransferase [Herbihabitans rhizosphaerae]RZS32835.1 S-adenosyl methyltransferase [Herbihabitans rhizosphaerae]
MNDPSWVPPDIDVTMPSAARVYDYLLGGAHNFAVDRAVGEKFLQTMKNGTQLAGSNRGFLRRAVLHMVEQGVTQFLDLGSGIPTVGNVHEIAQAAAPGAKVVYVDYDDVAVAHSEVMLQDNDNAAVVHADLTEPDTVLSDPATRALLDFDKPIGLLVVAVLHFVPHEKRPLEIMAAYRDALPAGSMLALSHLTRQHDPEGMGVVIEEMKDTRDSVTFRGREEILALFDGFDVIEPGVISAPRWRPERADEDYELQDVYAGVGRKER